MFTKKITYTNYDGIEVTEEFRFHLNKAEILEMQMGTPGGLSAMLQRIVDAKDSPAIMKEFKDLILKSYGVKSDDGRFFRKSEELSRDFSQTEAYSQLFMELCMNDGAAAEFINNVIPTDLREQVAKMGNNVGELPTGTAGV